MRLALVILYRSVLTCGAIIFGMLNVWSLAHGGDGRGKYIFFLVALLLGLVAVLPFGRRASVRRPREVGSAVQRRAPLRAAVATLAYVLSLFAIAVTSVVVAQLIADGAMPGA